MNDTNRPPRKYTSHGWAAARRCSAAAFRQHKFSLLRKMTSKACVCTLFRAFALLQARCKPICDLFFFPFSHSSYCLSLSREVRNSSMTPFYAPYSVQQCLLSLTSSQYSTGEGILLLTCPGFQRARLALDCHSFGWLHPYRCN